ncbi:uncharacterized protein LOC134034238 [Osmerus eperlanus]|uniref:uncharacterized protein LOC134034238 n=1 Tax=Osmerus eperlanus TaxID=29151 RepID=UPI002E0FEA26
MPTTKTAAPTTTDPLDSESVELPLHPGFPGSLPGSQLPGSPGNPPYPQLPGYPGSPPYPQLPGYPGSPPYPQLPGYPGSPPYPQLLGYPGSPPYPQLPGYPGSLPYPQLPGYPGSPPSATTRAAPVNPQMPTTMTAAPTTADPLNSESVELPLYPGFPGSPQFPGSPGSPQFPGSPGSSVAPPSATTRADADLSDPDSAVLPPYPWFPPYLGYLRPFPTPTRAAPSDPQNPTTADLAYPESPMLPSYPGFPRFPGPFPTPAPMRFVPTSAAAPGCLKALYSPSKRKWGQHVAPPVKMYDVMYQDDPSRQSNVIQAPEATPKYSTTTSPEDQSRIPGFGPHSKGTLPPPPALKDS